MTESEFSLSGHHRDLEAHFERLVTRCQGGDPLEMRCEWSLFERELNEHMELEEQQLIPRFRRDCPAQAAQICREHAEIRGALAQLGIGLDLNSLRADAVIDFVALLRGHARREEELFYRWVQRQSPTGPWQLLGQRLGVLSRNISAAFDTGSRSEKPLERGN